MWSPMPKQMEEGMNTMLPHPRWHGGLVTKDVTKDE
jgi:hypothetical protein